MIQTRERENDTRESPPSDPSPPPVLFSLSARSSHAPLGDLHVVPQPPCLVASLRLCLFGARESPHVQSRVLFLARLHEQTAAWLLSNYRVVLVFQHEHEPDGGTQEQAPHPTVRGMLQLAHYRFQASSWHAGRRGCR
jgi:hypothetical protein